MAGEWFVVFQDRFGAPLGDWRPQNLHLELVNSDTGPFTFELALGDPFLTRDRVGVPWKNSATIYRVATNGASNVVTGGPVTGRNLNDERDTLLISCADWIEYFKRRIYPFSQDYLLYNEWENWPKQWPVPTAPSEPSNPDVDLKDIVQDILQAMMDEDPDNAPPLVWANSLTGKTGRYKIYPGDRTTIYDHLKSISQQGPRYGFEFDVNPMTLEFRMFYPDRDGNVPVYDFRVSLNPNTGEISAVDWTDEGPKANWTLGLGQGTDKGIKLAGVDSFDPAGGIREFWRTDQVVDFGNVPNQTIINAKTSREGFLARFQQKKLRLELATPEVLTPNFWTGGRPRSLVGNRIRFRHDFGYHMIDANYKIQRITIDVDNDGNDQVVFELEQIYE